MSEPSRIPEITDERLALLVRRIKPAVRDARGRLRPVKGCEPRGESFLWSPEYIWWRWWAPRVKHLRDIVTFHIPGSTMGVRDFMPTLAEVLAQIPEEIVDRVKMFEVVDGPQVLTERCNTENPHVATTRLYG